MFWSCVNNSLFSKKNEVIAKISKTFENRKTQHKDKKKKIETIMPKPERKVID